MFDIKIVILRKICTVDVLFFVIIGIQIGVLVGLAHKLNGDVYLRFGEIDRVPLMATIIG